MDNYHRHLTLLPFNESASVVVGDVVFCYLFRFTHRELWRFLCQSSFDLTKMALKLMIAIEYAGIGRRVDGWRVKRFGHWPVTYRDYQWHTVQDKRFTRPVAYCLVFTALYGSGD